MNWVLSDDRWCRVARDSDDLLAPLFVRSSVGVRRNALCGFAWASALAFCRQAAWRQGAVVRLRRGGLVEALELAQLRLLIRYLRRVRVLRGAIGSPTAYSGYAFGVIDGQKFFLSWNGDRGPLAMTRLVVLAPLSLSLRLTHLSRHSVVAPIPAAPLLTDTRRSAVGSGTREDIVTMPDEMRVHDAVHVRDFQRARHARGDPDWCRRRAFGVRVHPLDAGCTAHRDAGNDGVVHRKDATRFAKRVMKSVAKAINDAAVACSRGVAASRLF